MLRLASAGTRRPARLPLIASAASAAMMIGVPVEPVAAATPVRNATVVPAVTRPPPPVAVPAADTVITAGAWSVRTHVEAGGATSASASATAADGTARLVVRCDRSGDPVVSVQFLPKPPFAAASMRPVSIQADGGPTLGTNWEFPGGGAFTRSDAVVTNLAVVIAAAKKIRVRAIDPAEHPVDAVFDGPADAGPIRRVLAACGYQLGQVPVRAAADRPTASDQP